MTEDNRRRTAALLSEAWDGSPIKRVRAGDGVSILNGRRLAIHIMIQPGGAADFLGSEALLDQGLLSRFLVASPESLAGTRFHRDVPSDVDATIRQYSAHLLRLLEAKPALLPPEFIANELNPRELPIGQEACSVWIEFHDRIEGLVGAVLPGPGNVVISTKTQLLMVRYHPVPSWTIPASRVKTCWPHRMPLPLQAITS